MATSLPQRPISGPKATHPWQAAFGVRSPRRSWALLACVGLMRVAVAQEQLTDHQRHVERAGTILMVAIPASALLATWALDPEQSQSAKASDSDLLLMGGTPRHDLLLALGRTALVTGALKYGVDETRPNGGSHSFPSGHSSAAFTGAEFIRKEYGWRWGAPAYLAAGFVAWSRVKADKHYTHDVVAGAAVGILANHDFWQRPSTAGSLRLGAGPMSLAGRSVPALQFVWTR